MQRVMAPDRGDMAKLTTNTLGALVLYHHVGLWTQIVHRPLVQLATIIFCCTIKLLKINKIAKISQALYAYMLAITLCRWIRNYQLYMYTYNKLFANQLTKSRPLQILVWFLVLLTSKIGMRVQGIIACHYIIIPLRLSDKCVKHMLLSRFVISSYLK